MAGAVISNVGDYTSPYWNPAGLMNGEGMSATFFLTDIIPLSKYEYTDVGIDAEANANHYFAPNAAFLWNCKLAENLRMGLSFIVPAGLGVEWDGADFTAFGGPVELVPGVPNVFAGDILNWEAQIGVWNASLSSAYRFGDKFNVGGAFHFVGGSMEMKRGIDVMDVLTSLQDPGIPAGTPIPGSDGMIDTQYDEESDGIGWGLGFGFQYMFNEKFTVGGMLRTRQTVGFEGNVTISNSAAGVLADYSFERDITWPLMAGGGITFRPTEKLLLAAEALWSQWSETQDYLIATHDSEKDTLTLLWDDAIQIRFGAEYMTSDQLTLRAGVYHDPAPGPDKTHTILIPQTDFLGITGGASYTVNKLTFDAGLEYLFGTERDLKAEDLMEGVGMPGIHNLNIIAWSLGVTYKF
jgi:long-chain fatty acid transport protein